MCSDNHLLASYSYHQVILHSDLSGKKILIIHLQLLLTLADRDVRADSSLVITSSKWKVIFLYI